MQTDSIILERHRLLPADMVERAISGRLSTDDFFALQGKPELMRMADLFDEVAFNEFFKNEQVREVRDLAGKWPLIRGGSRENDIMPLVTNHPAASAGNVPQFRGIPAYRGGTVGGYQWRGWFWLYETAEANTDNTLDFVIDNGVSATFTALFTNGNANGLLDTGAILTPFTNMGNAASGGATAIAVTPTVTKLAVATTVRHNTTTAGTGTIPALQMGSYGVFL